MCSGYMKQLLQLRAQFIQTDKVWRPGEPWRRLDPGDLAPFIPNLNLIGAASAVDGIHPLSGAPPFLRSQSSTASSSEVGLFLLLKRALHELLSLLRGGEALVDVFVLVVDEVLVLLKLVVLAAEELVEL